MHRIHTYMRARMHAYTGTYIMFLCCLVIHRDILVSEHVPFTLDASGWVGFLVRIWTCSPKVEELDVHAGTLGKSWQIVGCNMLFLLPT